MGHLVPFPKPTEVVRQPVTSQPSKRKTPSHWIGRRTVPAPIVGSGEGDKTLDTTLGFMAEEGLEARPSLLWVLCRGRLLGGGGRAWGRSSLWRRVPSSLAWAWA